MRAGNYLGRRLVHRRLFRNTTADSLTEVNYDLPNIGVYTRVSHMEHRIVNSEKEAVDRGP